MRTRDVTIPLGLWICAAICAHFLFGTGGLVVAKVHEDQSELLKLSHQASNLAQRGEQTFEVSMNEPGEQSPEAPPPPPPPPPKPPEPPKPPPAKAKVEEKRTPEQKKKDEKRVVVVEKKDEKKPPPLPDQAPRDQRIAVRQHAKPDQQDNPTAKFIADEANHVDKETRATQTSHDRDEEQPSPGATHSGADQQPGDSEKTRIAENEARAGEQNRAPGEKGTDLDVTHEPKIPKLEPQPTAATTPTPAQGGQRAPNTDERPTSQSPVMPQPAPGGAAPPSPEVESAPEGTWTFNPTRPGGPQGLTPQPTQGGSSAPPLPGGRMWTIAGLGQSSAPGTLNMNLNQAQVASLVGLDSLRKLREADGERRKSEHRGSWVASNFDRWRSAIENYVASVQTGNQTALNTAAVPFASYLNGMHNRIHPIFADAFLESLDGLPPNHPMNDQHLVTRLEIVLTKQGRLKRMGIVKTSGMTAFDIAALDAVDRAQPFGPAPTAIVSPDGNVYLHWEFHRDEVYACSTMNARPFILSTPPTQEPSGPQLPFPSPAGPARERGAPASNPNDAREGSLSPSSSPSEWTSPAAVRGARGVDPGYAAR
jgi:TonB family protein